MPRDDSDSRPFSFIKHGFWIWIPNDVQELLVLKGLALLDDSHGRKYELDLGGRFRFIEAEAGEWGARVLYRQLDQALFHLKRGNWYIQDPGWDLECDQLHGKIDVKTVPYPRNPVLMVRHYTPDEGHPPYPCDIFLNMWVEMDGMVPKRVGAVGWMYRDDVVKNPKFPVRDEFYGKELKRPCHCVQHWKQQRLQELMMEDLAASPQLELV